MIVHSVTTGNRVRGAALGLAGLLLSLHGWALGADPASPLVGDPERGRKVFNGIGGCFNCHGYDGVITNRPDYSPALSEARDRLNPLPADLRDAPRLKSTSEEERYRTITRGHPGTAMFPKPQLMEREIQDILAYLTVLREKRD